MLPLFKYGVELERRFYLANQVDIQPKELNGSVYFEVQLGMLGLVPPRRFSRRSR